MSQHRSRRLPVALLGLALGATALSLPASAADAPVEGSVITDAVGDANLLNGQGLTTAAGQRPAGTSTGPVNYAGADLEKVRFETTTTTAADGTKTPTGLKIHITTSGVPGSSANTLIYRVSTSISGCSSFLQAFVRGPASVPAPGTPTLDVAANTVQWRQLTGCAAAVTKTNPAWTVSIDAATRTLTMTFPFASMTQTDRDLFLPPPFEDEPATPGSLSAPEVGVRTFNGTLTAPQIDEAPIGKDFVIGSDA